MLREEIKRTGLGKSLLEITVAYGTYQSAEHANDYPVDLANGVLV